MIISLSGGIGLTVSERAGVTDSYPVQAVGKLYVQTVAHHNIVVSDVSLQPRILVILAPHCVAILEESPVDSIQMVWNLKSDPSCGLVGDIYERCQVPGVGRYPVTRFNVHEQYGHFSNALLVSSHPHPARTCSTSSSA